MPGSTSDEGGLSEDPDVQEEKPAAEQQESGKISWPDHFGLGTMKKYANQKVEFKAAGGVRSGHDIKERWVTFYMECKRDGLLPGGNVPSARSRHLVQTDIKSTFKTLCKQVGRSGQGALDSTRQMLYEVTDRAMALTPREIVEYIYCVLFFAGYSH